MMNNLVEKDGFIMTEDLESSLDTEQFGQQADSVPPKESAISCFLVRDENTFPGVLEHFSADVADKSVKIKVTCAHETALKLMKDPMLDMIKMSFGETKYNINLSGMSCEAKKIENPFGNPNLSITLEYA